MTAEDCITKMILEEKPFYNIKDIKKALIGFAQMKCKELLEIMAEKVEVKTKYKGLLNSSIFIDKNSILNAVDLNTFIQ